MEASRLLWASERSSGKCRELGLEVPVGATFHEGLIAAPPPLLRALGFAFVSSVFSLEPRAGTGWDRYRRGREFPMPGVSPLSPPLSQPPLELIEVLGVLFFFKLVCPISFKPQTCVVFPSTRLRDVWTSSKKVAIPDTSCHLKELPILFHFLTVWVIHQHA